MKEVATRIDCEAPWGLDLSPLNADIAMAPHTATSESHEIQPGFNTQGYALLTKTPDVYVGSPRATTWLPDVVICNVSMSMLGHKHVSLRGASCWVSSGQACGRALPRTHNYGWAMTPVVLLAQLR